jgi:hypothetical protein
VTGRRAGAVLAAVAAVALGACGSEQDRVGEAEAGIAEVFADRLAVDDVAVACPEDAELEAGTELACTVSVGGADPQEVAFAIGDGGAVRPTVAVIPTAAVEGHLAVELAAAAEGEVDADCGDAPLVVHDVGGTFTCAVVRASDGVAFDVTVEVRSLDGSVTYTVAATTTTTPPAAAPPDPAATTVPP